MVTRHKFEEELSNLHSMIVSMGVAVEDAIASTLEALINQDAKLAQEIIKNDDYVDNMELEIEKKCLDIIAKQQPVASDLRDITSALKLITDLERIADHASDISARILELTSKDKVMIHHDLITMGEIAKGMVTKSLDSYVTRNLEIAKEVVMQDDKVDALFLDLKEELLHLMSVDTKKIEQYVELLLICKYFERIADHAQNVAEWVCFYVEGKH